MSDVSRRPWMRWLGRRHVVALFFCVTTTIIAVQTWWTIAQDRHLTLEVQAQHGRVTVRLLEEHATRTLLDVVQTLDDVAARLPAAPAGKPAQDEAIRRAIAGFDLRHSPYLKALQYIDLDGRGWVHSSDYPPHVVDVSQRSHVVQLLAQPDHRQAVIGHPYTSRYDSQLVIPVARNLFDAQGRQVGILSVDLRVAYFGQFYARVAQENNASVALIADEGFVIVRSPFEARYVDRDLRGASALAQMQQSPGEGSLTDDSFLDDESARLYTYRKVTGAPITAVYGRDMDSILAPWQLRSRDRVAFSTVMVALIAALSLFLVFYIRSLQRSRASLRASEARFMGLFQCSPVPLVLARAADLRIREVNPAWETLLGFDRAAVIDRTDTELLISVQADERAQMMEHLVREGAFDCLDVQQRTKEGQVRVCLTSARVFDAAGEPLVALSFVDVTAQRATEAQIRELNQVLEQRVLARTETLAAANAELHAALDSLRLMQDELIRSEKMAALGSLVAGIAHELNTPIGNSLIVASTMLTQTRQTQQEFVGKGLRRSTLEGFLQDMEHGGHILQRSLERASELITSFKRVAVDQASSVRRCFDLHTAMHEVGLMLEPMYKSTPYRLVLEVPGGIEMDSYPGPLGQVVTNFVSNSLHHAFEGRSQGLMRLTAHVHEPKTVVLVFTDDGIGMDEEHCRRVFDPFFTTKMGRGGSGLGMHIVYNIVTDLLQGTIQLHSVPGEGVTITLTLPLKVCVDGAIPPGGD